jgi:hypothetical protein
VVVPEVLVAAQSRAVWPGLARPANLTLTPHPGHASVLAGGRPQLWLGSHDPRRSQLIELEALVPGAVGLNAESLRAEVVTVDHRNDELKEA